MKKFLRSLPCTIVFALMVLTGCGRIEQPLSAIEPASGQQFASITPTMTWFEATKAVVEAGITQEVANIATGQAGGDIPTPTGTIPAKVRDYQTQVALDYTDTPMPLLPEGQIVDCGYDNPKYNYGNCWRINHDNISYTMLVGAFSDEPEQGVVKLGLVGEYLAPGQAQKINYPTPQKVGIIEVASAAWPNVVVRTQAEPRTTFTFNLETRQWTSINGTPVAPTPTTTPIPPTATGVPASGSVLFVANAITLNAADTAIKARIEAWGYTVVVKAAGAAQSSDATGTLFNAAVNWATAP